MTHSDPDLPLREKLLGYAKAHGATEADAIAIRAQNLDVSVRKGAIEDANRAESFGIGLRLFKGTRHAYGSTADASDEGLRRLAQQVSDMASAVPEDSYSRLAHKDEFAKSWTDLDLYDASEPLSVAQLVEKARATEDTALGVTGITNSDGAQAGQGIHWIGLSTSAGFSGSYVNTGTHISVSVVAGASDAMETDHASSHTTYVSDLEAPESVGRRAADRTLARLNPGMGKTGHFPVLFDRRASASLLRSLARAISGPRLAKGTSFLSGRLNKQICSANITVIDDPLKLRGLRSSPFDAEGLPVMRRAIVENGVLKFLFLDLRSAARLSMTPTGHATRSLSSPPSPSPANLWIEPGAKSRDDMISDMGEGLLVTDLMGSSISLATGDYSRGASGFWIQGGKISHPVSEMTIAGNLKDMFMNMTPSSDLLFVDGIDAPSLLVEGMTTATR